jgi:hypothetical protein
MKVILMHVTKEADDVVLQIGEHVRCRIGNRCKQRLVSLCMRMTKLSAQADEDGQVRAPLAPAVLPLPPSSYHPGQG